MDLRQFPLFARLPEAQVPRFVALLQLKTYGRREIVFRKDADPDRLYLLFSGSLQVLDITGDGREIGIELIQPGSFFGALSVIDGLPRPAHIVALEPSEVGVVPQGAARDAFLQVPGFAEAMLQHLTGMVRKLAGLRALLAIPSAQQRVYALLWQLTRHMPGGLLVIPNLPRQHEVAIMINTTRETVSRAIAHLCATGIVQRDLKRLIVRDPDRLRSLAAQPGRAAGIPQLRPGERRAP